MMNLILVACRAKQTEAMFPAEKVKFDSRVER